MKRISPFASAVALAFAGLLLAGTAAFAMTWQEVIDQATAKGEPGVSKEMAHDFATREKQFAGFAPWVDQYLAEIDTNHDGMISKAEMKRWMIVHHMSDEDLMKEWYQQ